MSHRSLQPALTPRPTRPCVNQAFALVIIVAALTMPSATAGVAWCRSDPIVVIDDQVADLFVDIRFDDLPSIKGRTEIVIFTPVDVTTRLATPGIGHGHGENVRFEESASLEKTEKGIEVRIGVYVPAHDRIRVRVHFAPNVVGVLKPASARGEANEWITLGARLEPVRPT